jgi:dephospho-CoA kinase
MITNDRIRISVVAPSGAGKSTVASLLKQAFGNLGLTAEVVKLAAPLYAIQARIYEECGQQLSSGKQDQRLLETIANEMRVIAPKSIVENFLRRLSLCKADVVINDDLRDDRMDWPCLVAEGFRVVRVVTTPSISEQRLSSRGDVNLVANSRLNEQIAQIGAEYVLVNHGTIDDLRFQVDALAEKLAAGCSAA